MNIDHLIIFINLAETLNFTQTAQKVHMSQSSVSQVISSLEKKLQVQLFIRDHHNVKLSKSGMMFYQKIKPIINSYNKAVQLTHQQANRENSNISISSTGSPFEEQFLPSLIMQFNNKFADIKLYVEFTDHDTVKENLINQNSNLIFATQDDIADLKGINYYPLLHGKFVALVPKQFSISQKSQFSTYDFNDQSIILMDSHWAPPEQWKIQEKIIKNNTNLNIAYANNVTAVNTMANSGIGIAIMPDFIACPDIKYIKEIPISDSVPLTYGIAKINTDDSSANSNFIKEAQNFNFSHFL